MLASVRALMTGLIDYAGLFPPAALPIDQTVANYLQYLSHPDRWMLGTVIIPATRLSELAPLLAASPGPIAVSALGRGGKNLPEFVDGFRQDIECIKVARSALAGKVLVDVVELKLPPAPTEDTIRAAITQCGKVQLTPFVEGAGEAVPTILRASQLDKLGGLKLRCGGVEASAFPSVEDLARAITLARDADVPLKFTAGLHHPIRHFNESVQTKMHGFVNVFFAALAAWSHKLGVHEVEAILAEENPRAFTFSDDSIAHGAVRVGSDMIASLRKSRVTSFGSCSFDEPRDDLRSLEPL